MGKNARCDLAVEAHELLCAEGKNEHEGIILQTENVGGYIRITRVKVMNEEGARALGKKPGNYTTVEMPGRFYGMQKIYEDMCRVCAKELKKLTDPFLKDDDSSVFVVGLGNWNITADALGPKVVKSLMVTRHLKEYIPEEIDEGIRPVSAFAPGVLGITGIETAELVKGVSDKLKPDLIIAIDALCSRRAERVNSTVQFCDTGITPGEGVGNKRKAMDYECLGVPVIAIGVPTVVDASAIADETLEAVEKCSDAKMAEEVYDFVSERFGNMIVAPKEVDAVTDDLSRVIANGINISLHSGIKLSDIDKYR